MQFNLFNGFVSLKIVQLIFIHCFSIHGYVSQKNNFKYCIRFVESSSSSSAAREPHSSSRMVSGASSSSVSEAASKDSHHQKPTDNTSGGAVGGGGSGHIKWRCFAKAVTSNDILLTFVPSSFQDVKLLLLDDEAMQPTKKSNTIDVIQGRTREMFGALISCGFFGIAFFFFALISRFGSKAVKK